MGKNERPGAVGTSAIGMPYMVVTVDSLDGDYAMVSDQFRNRRQIDLRLRRGKFPGPAVGESWIIDRVLGVWSFAAIVNYEGSGGGGAPTGPVFSYAGEVGLAVSGFHVFRSAVTMTEVTISALLPGNDPTTIKFFRAYEDFPDTTLLAIEFPGDTRVFTQTVSVSFAVNDTIFISAAPQGGSAPTNLVVQTVVEAS